MSLPTTPASLNGESLSAPLVPTTDEDKHPSTCADEVIHFWHTKMVHLTMLGLLVVDILLVVTSIALGVCVCVRERERERDRERERVITSDDIPPLLNSLLLLPSEIEYLTGQIRDCEAAIEAISPLNDPHEGGFHFGNHAFHDWYAQMHLHPHLH
jgi:hypothetical protein